MVALTVEAKSIAGVSIMGPESALKAEGLLAESATTNLAASQRQNRREMLPVAERIDQPSEHSQTTRVVVRGRRATRRCTRLRKRTRR
jgi:hypothetical protein